MPGWCAGRPGAATSSVAGAAVRQQAAAFRANAERRRSCPVLWWILFAIIWITIAFWAARVAGRKGYSFIGYFIVSLFFFPAAIIAACLVHDRTEVPAGATAAVS
jgi:hypothetical protein